MTVNLLDPVTLPIRGQCLIEASAGTGKTFTLAALYLRLLLGLGKGELNRPLGVDEILVVTFTEAATQELRDRIRSRIREARQAYLEGESSDPILSQLLAESTDFAAQARLLELAASEMDQAAIFTIHGFCQRMLRQHAFESGASFTQTLTTDDLPLVRQALLDYWRETFYLASDDLAMEMLGHFGTPEKLLAELRGFLGMESLVQQPDLSAVDLPTEWQKFKQAVAAFKAQWLESVGDLSHIIEQSGVNKRSYSTRNLPNWLTIVTDFCESTDNSVPWDKLAHFRASVLAEKTPKGSPPEHPLFTAADVLFDLAVPVKEVLLSRGLTEIRKRLLAEKQRQQLMTFDDLLSRLAVALRGTGGETLATVIRQQYPVAMIDEFQDTDPLQYDIFSRIYPDESTALLMIGDPKQSIYAFRGADIFTYMRARQQVSAHYTLETNWRSSSAMVNAVNHLFSYAASPFLYDQDIPFLPVSASPKADSTPFTLHGQPQAPLTCWLEPELISSGDYLKRFASRCALHIAQVLKDTAWQIGDRSVEPSDIAVLVRDRKEAREVQQALQGCGVASVFLSNRDSVFTTREAKELLYLLTAIAEPTDERSMRTAIATQIFQLDLQALDQLCQNELAWEMLVEEFQHYRDLWLRLGVLPMLHNLIAHRGLAKGLVALQGGERSLTDLLHLGELLQQASQETEGLSGIIRWLAEHIANPNQNADEQQMRLESDRSRVTVITIHKSKGLEYGLVYLPFICRYRETTSSLYHDEQGQVILNHQPDDNVKAQAKKERLAEDLRLLYVAVTRAVHACFMGMADIRYRGKQGMTHESAIGYLLQQDKEMPFPEVMERFAQSCPEAVVLPLPEPKTTNDTLGLFDQIDKSQPLSESGQQGARAFTGQIERDWRVTSYSSLSRFHSVEPITAMNLDLEVMDEPQQEAPPLEEPSPSIFTFPKGAVAGTFLHTILENIDFSQLEPETLRAVLEHHLQLSGFDESWADVLQAYFTQMLTIPLTPAGCRLMDIDLQARLVEMEFILPFKHLAAEPLNQLIRASDPLSSRAGELIFDQVQGMLKGYIDLIIRYQGRYYVIDYKSNYLGSSPADYHQSAMEEAMIDHRYDLQYQLYTLALHRFLRNRLPGYDYEEHVGGVFYLFLRGMQTEEPEHGVFYTRPDLCFIEQLDHLFFEGSL